MVAKTVGTVPSPHQHFQRFMTFDKKLSGVLKTGDLIRMFHVEEDGYLIARVKDEVSHDARTIQSAHCSKHRI